MCFIKVAVRGYFLQQVEVAVILPLKFVKKPSVGRMLEAELRRECYLFNTQLVRVREVAPEVQVRRTLHVTAIPQTFGGDLNVLLEMI